MAADAGSAARLSGGICSDSDLRGLLRRVAAGRA